MLEAGAALATAHNANVVQNYAHHANVLATERVKNSVRIETSLSARDERVVRDCVPGLQLIFTGTKNMGPQHTVAAALRQIARQMHTAAAGVQAHNRALRVLAVGATEREISVYGASSPNVCFLLHGSESKDVARLQAPLYRAIVAMAKKKGVTPPSRFSGLEELRAFYNTLAAGEAKERLYVDTGQPPKADVLLMEDCVYNMGEKGICEVFAATEATTAYGYALLPYELLFPGMVASEVYRYEERGPRAILTWLNDSSNGYVHDKWDWSTLLRKPVLQHGGVRVASELYFSAGPIVCFKLWRVSATEAVVRSISLPEHMLFVHVLDLERSFEPGTSNVARTGLKYLSVLSDDFYRIVNYASSLAPASLTLQVVISYVRKVMNGISLGVKQLDGMRIRPRDVPKVAAIAMLFVRVRYGLLSESADALVAAQATNWDFTKYLIWQTVVNAITWPVSALIDWLRREALYDRMVLEFDGTQVQYTEPGLAIHPSRLDVGDIVWHDGERQEVEHAPFEPPECHDSETPASAGDAGVTPGSGSVLPAPPGQCLCSVCSELSGKLGQQKLLCGYKPNSTFDFRVSEADMLALRVSLQEQIDENAVPELVKVLRAAKEALASVPSEQEHLATLEVVVAGPGSGKSYAIRQMYTARDAIVLPFNKLRSDYPAEGEKRYTAKTPHHALATLGTCDTLFVDEAYCLCFTLLRAIVLKTNASRVVLVGDPLQTELLASEGVPLSSRVDIERYSQHRLLKNFRNPPAVVELLNSQYGYAMEPAKKEGRPVRLVSLEAVNFDDYKEHTILCFSKAVAKIFRQDEKCIRSYQGSTVDKVLLVVTGGPSDHYLTKQRALQIVGMSRAKEELVVAVANTTACAAVAAQMGLGTEFNQTFMAFTGGFAVAGDTAVAEAVAPEEALPAERAAMDSHLALAEIIPLEATAPDVTAHNLVTSAVIDQGFRTAVVHPEEMVAPIGSGGKPQATAVEYNSMGPGVGNHFTSANPGATVNVVGARYDTAVQPQTLVEGAEAVCARVVAQYFENYMATELQPLSEAECEDVCTRAYADLVKRGLVNRVRDAEVAAWKTIRFMIKDIFKVKTAVSLSAVDLFKAGQGISMWDAGLIVAHTCFARCLSALCRKNERHDHWTTIITDDKKSEEQFLAEVNASLSRLPESCTDAVVDGVQFDAQQNEATQLIERMFAQRLGIDDRIIDSYYAFRRNYAISAKYITAQPGFQKTSGEPLTLEGNGIIVRAIGTYILDGNGPSFTTFKGDDFYHRRQSVAVNEAKKIELENIMPLRLKVTLSTQGMEFCGLAIVAGMLVPSVVRRASKLAGHRFASYEHFTMVQQSLRNFTAMVARLQRAADTDYIVQANALLYGMPVEQARAFYDALVALSHISKAQFDDLFYRRQEVALLISADNMLTVDLTAARQAKARGDDRREVFADELDKAFQQARAAEEKAQGGFDVAVAKAAIGAAMHKFYATADVKVPVVSCG